MSCLVAVPLVCHYKLNASIVTDHNAMRLKVSPACLLDALWLQLAQAQSGQTKPSFVSVLNAMPLDRRQRVTQNSVR
jgi:hypothetical protein